MPEGVKREGDPEPESLIELKEAASGILLVARDRGVIGERQGAAKKKIKTQKEIAGEVGVGPATIVKWESGQDGALIGEEMLEDESIMARVKEAYGLTPEELARLIDLTRRARALEGGDKARIRAVKRKAPRTSKIQDQMGE